MLSCSIWFSAPSFWWVVHHPHRKHDLSGGSQDHHPSKNSVRRKPYAATQHLMLLMMGVCTVPETCRAKNTSIKLPSCMKLAFHFISCPLSLCGSPNIKINIFALTFVFHVWRQVCCGVHCLIFPGVFGKFCISVVFYITRDQKKTRFFSFDFPSDVRYVKYHSVSHIS